MTAVERLAAIKEAHFAHVHTASCPNLYGCTEPWCEGCEQSFPCDAVVAVAAVEKVLELHRPGKFHMRLTDGGWRYRCAGCGRPWDLATKDGRTTRPCPTVRAVEEALG